MILEHKDLPLFEPLIRSIHSTAFTTGINYLDNKGKDFEDLQKDPYLFKPFVKYCHKGYDKAQRLIAKEIFSLVGTKKDQQSSLKIARSGKNVLEITNTINLIRIIENRILVLRRLIDTIALTLILNRVWIARRFILNEAIRNLEIDAIKTTLKEASDLNEKDRLQFSLLTDLSTFIDVGDLLQVDFNEQPAKWTITELKAGKINKILEEVIEQEGEDLNTNKLQSIEDEINIHAAKQAERMVRQRKRIGNINKIVTTDIGEDISSGMPIVLSKDEFITTGYMEVLKEAARTATEVGFSAHLVDKCLYVISAKGSKNDATHLLYHFLNPDAKCLITENVEDTKKELLQLELLAENHLFVDLVEFNLIAKSSSSFFLYGFSEEIMFDLLFGRINILLYLDINKFSELCKSKGFSLSLCSTSETEGLRQKFGRKIAPLYNKKIIKVKTPKGFELCLFGGIFHKMFVDIIRPKEMLEMWEIQDSEISSRSDLKEAGDA